jgi:hypothetical protein
VPAPWLHYVALNTERALALKESGNITAKQEPKEGPGCRRRG